MPASVISGQKEREQVQFKAAEAIDLKVAGTSVETPVKAETARIVRANQIAPATNVEALVASYEATIKAKASENEALEKKIVELQDAERKKQVTLLRLIGVGAVLAAVALGYFRMTGFAALAGATALFAFGMGQLISQPWFATVFNWSLGTTAAIAVGVGIYEWRRVIRTRALSSSEALIAKETREALLVAIEQIDLARSLEGFEAYYSKMLENWDWSEKDIVNKLRSEVALENLKREHA
ncbi:MAG: hypothetical protein EBR82_21585 [Caulobacteraceae bacterium]|nr:hypothetical protein [Caulobacteraceae bacterium]